MQVERPHIGKDVVAAGALSPEASTETTWPRKPRAQEVILEQELNADLQVNICPCTSTHG